MTRPKLGKHEVVPLNRTAWAVLAALPQEAEQLLPHLPTKLSDLFIRYARKAGLADVPFHGLCDTYIFRLAPHCTTPTLMALAPPALAEPATGILTGTEEIHSMKVKVV